MKTTKNKTVTKNSDGSVTLRWESMNMDGCTWSILEQTFVSRCGCIYIKDGVSTPMCSGLNPTGNVIRIKENEGLMSVVRRESRYV